MWQHRAQLAIEFGSHLFEKSTWQGLIVLAIAGGSVLVAGLIIWVSECLGRRQSTKRWELEEATQKYRERTTYRRGAVIRVLGMLLAIITFLVGVTIGFNAAGINFWTLALGGGFVMWTVANAFGIPLSNVAAYLIISVTERVEEDWYMSIQALGVEGRIKSINVMGIEQEYHDVEAGLQEITTPCTAFLQYPIKRLFKKEKEFNAQFKETLNPNIHVRSRLGSLAARV